MIDTIYKIKRNRDGLFSTGGADPKWTMKGKIWRQKGHLSAHLNVVGYYKDANHFYKDCTVVEYEITQIESVLMSMEKFIAEKEDRTADRKQKQKAAHDAYIQEVAAARWKKWATANPELAAAVIADVN